MRKIQYRLRTRNGGHLAQILPQMRHTKLIADQPPCTARIDSTHSVHESVRNKVRMEHVRTFRGNADIDFPRDIASSSA
jgi:hypothetical protein